MTFNTSELATFGWTQFFAAQIGPEEVETRRPVRVIAVHRSRLDVVGPGLELSVSPFAQGAAKLIDEVTTGDWLLLDKQTMVPARRLERSSLFKRRAVSEGRTDQLIAANVDTLFIVTSCNEDFNIARLERYLVLAREAGVMPVIILTKADLTDTPEIFLRDAARLAPGLLVEIVDARSPESLSCLAPWLRAGETIAFVGSSGVGKSTLINTLAGSAIQDTREIREEDAKGRHTTTGRTLHRMPGGVWLLDTPGMREIQLTDVQAGIDEVFDDVIALVAQCRFSDCQHASEPGCAVQQAISDGVFDSDRLKRWAKLAREDAFNSATLAERRRKDRNLHKMYDRHQKAKRKRLDDD